jgi:mannose-6-phosphate isomerase-like protein (cupin superfamily)
MTQKTLRPDLPRPFSLARTFVHLERDGSATPMRVDGAFWTRLREQTLDGRLAGAFRMIRNTGWERLPDGDGLLYLLAGAIDVVLETDAQQHTVELRAGKSLIIPRGTWHRLLVRERGELLFFTPGPRIERRSARTGAAAPAGRRGRR